MIDDMPVYHEAYYRDGRTSETERLCQGATAPLAVWTPAPKPSRFAADSAYVVAGVLISIGVFLLGYQTGYLAGVLAPWWNARGWIALLFMAIGLPIYGIWYSNKKEV